jgi:hypothetical protein
MDPIELLARDDRWQLSAGEGLIVAPPHPLWLDAPAFWDGASLLGTPLAPLFTVTLLDDDGRELALGLTSRRWTPAEVTAEYGGAGGLVATEVRTVQPGGILASEWRIEALRPTAVHLIAWTALRAGDLDGPVRFDSTITFRLRGRPPEERIEGALACINGATSWSLAGSDAAPLHPHWKYTPFAGQWSTEGLPESARATQDGTVCYAAIHRALFVSDDGAATAFAMRLASSEPVAAPGPPKGTARGPHAATLGGASRRRWREVFQRAPAFRCSDPYVEHCYWYRWSTLELLSAGARGVCEGTGRLHRLTSHAAAAHVRDLRWMHDPRPARNAMRSICDHVRADGTVPVMLEPPGDAADTPLAVGDWGGALLALDAVHPDDPFLQHAYGALARHARWLLDHRTRPSGLIAVKAGEVAYDDRERWGAREEIAGVDAAVAAYGLFVALGRSALRANVPEQAEGWDRAAQRLAGAVRSQLWDDNAHLFRDADPATTRRVGPLCAVGFYPYRTDLADARHLPGLVEHLLDPRGFWTMFPVATRRADDASFSRFGSRRGARGADPFAGPVVPFVNSHLIDGLARAARAYAPHLREKVAHLLRRTVRMFFDGADTVRIGSYEYYDPIESLPSVHRDATDSTHSWMIDAIIQYVAGLRPHEGGVTIDPLPLGMELVELVGVRVRGHVIDVRIEGDRVTAVIDGAARDGRLGTAMEIAL